MCAVRPGRGRADLPPSPSPSLPRPPPLPRDCDQFIDAVGPNRPFLGGASPNLADLAVYGVLKAVDKTPTFEDAMKGSRIGAWYGRVTQAVGGSSRAGPSEGSSWGLGLGAK